MNSQTTAELSKITSERLAIKNDFRTRRIDQITYLETLCALANREDALLKAVIRGGN